MADDLKTRLLKARIALAAQKAGVAAPETSLTGQVLGRTARMGAQGAASILDIAGNPIKAVISMATGQPQVPSYREQVSGVLDAAGVAGYENSPTGRITGAVGEGMVGAGGMAKAADLAARGATGVSQQVAGAMAAEPGRQVAAGAGAALGSQGAAEAGVGTTGQLLFGLAGGAAGYAMSGGRPAPRQPAVSVETLRAKKTAAYKAVDDAGDVFAPDEMAAMAQKAREYLAETNYYPDVDVQTKAVMGKLDNTASEVLSIGKLDKLRQDAWARYNKSGEVGLLGIIDSIDETIAARPATNALMAKARDAHASYKKAELLDLQFDKAARQTAATGSGGNILNKMRQAVSNILNNPRQAKWFSEAEKAAMDKFITGTPSQNVLRLVGKLAPTGNGLMTAINLMAVATNPLALAGSGIATAAKVISDNATTNAGIRLIDTVAGSAPAPRMNALTGYGAALPSQLPALSNR